MGKLTVFNFVTLNGYFQGTDGDLSWHKHGEEESEYGMEGLESGNTLLFGRITYEQMASFWPTPAALKNAPDMAKGMNNAEKIVFSKTLKKADWQNTRVVKDMITEVKKLKKESGKNMTVLGSGSIITQLANEGLIDEYEIMIDPVALGKGTPIFNEIKHTLNFKLVNSRIFKTGVVLLSYQPVTK